MKNPSNIENFTKNAVRRTRASIAIATLPLVLVLAGCSQSTPSTPPPAQPIAVVQPIPSPEKLDLRGVAFQRDGKLLPSSRPVLDAAAQLLKTQPDTKVYINAYCDPIGGAKLNQKISEERAEAVRAYLVKDGVPSEQLVARGRGASDFIASNATPEGRKQNRRIELVIVRS